MATLFANQFFDTNGSRQKGSEDPRSKAAAVVRMRNDEDSQTSEARKKFDAELVRAKVNIFLRNVDRHIKSGEIEEAERELRKAKELEPRNLYIHAFEERVAHIKLVHTQPPINEIAQPPTTQPMSLPNASPDGPTVPEIERAREMREMIERTREIERAREIERTREIERAKEIERAREIERMRQTNPTNRTALTAKTTAAITEPEGGGLNSVRETTQPKPTENTSQLQRSHNENSRVTRSLSVPHSWRKRCLEAYKQCLMEIWTQGAMTSQESLSLNALRERLEIDDAEHRGLERDVQWRIYINAIMEGCLFTLTGADKIERLREEFHIPAEAHLKIMKKTRQEILSLVNEYSVTTNEKNTITQPQLQ